MKDIRKNMGQFEANHQNTNPGPEAGPKKEAATASKGDYIDFEEIK